MSTSKFFDVIVAVVLVLALGLTSALLYLGNRESAVETMASVRDVPYEEIFDQFQVMEIEIGISEADFADMLSNPLAEEYKQCDVTVNGTLYTDAAIRTKGNTSLTQVASSDSDRYSFKIEFDHYDKNKSMDGLDKLVLNNLFCDAAYVKEYIAYDIFHYMGVETPYYAFANITVNGEGIGCYLALEAMEDSFVQRVYGGEGQLYKPESSMAGGGGPAGFGRREGMEPPETEELPEGMEPPETGGLPEGMERSETEELPEGMEPPGMGELPEGMEPPETGGLPDGTEASEDGKAPDGTEVSGRGERPERMGTSESLEMSDGMKLTENEEIQDDRTVPSDGRMPGRMERPEGRKGGFGGGESGSGSDLVYTDDNPDSYSDIFENASFDITEEDEQRVIQALQKMNAGEELEQYVDVDACLRYFAAQTFIVNMDSYYSNLKHNYYLYERDGQLTILPWDLNLAFGGFQSGNATEAVNSAVDTPMDGLEEDRPLFSKLMEVEEYREQYHACLEEIVDGYVNSGQFTEVLSKVEAAIAPYVEKDATAFYSYQEFTEAMETLETFVLLRAESVEKQLDGEIPSVSEERNQDTVLVDASGISLSTMGMQGGDGAGGKGSRDGNMFGGMKDRKGGDGQ